MKHIKKIFAIALAAVMLLSCVPSAFAATSETAGIDYEEDCSLTIYKYDWTNLLKDGLLGDNALVSSGWRDTIVEDSYGQGPEQILGNGQTSNGYAISGVEFTIANVAIPFTYSGQAAFDTHGVLNLYAFDKVMAADLLAAIGLPDGKDAVDFFKYYEEGDIDESLYDYWFYGSNQIVDALAAALETNATEVKNALEAYVKNNGGIALAKTDADGRTSIDGLEFGLYIVVETAVPEMVTSTTNPFFISLPMTTVNNICDGSAPEGGSEWNYDVTVYPKSHSGIPSLEKTVRESVSDTGHNNGSDAIDDKYAHTATGSAGDTMEYQIISSLPTITSQATALSTYNFFDTIAPGMTYNKDVKIEFFTDKACTDKVATWTQEDGKFTVSYSEDGQSMTIDVTAAGLAEINGDTENVNGNLYAGYSNYTARVTYSAEIDSDTSFVYGEEGNCNKVVLTWKRTSGDYYDTLIDDCHVYSFGINLTKEFVDKLAENAEADGMYDYVKFVIQNASDNYWVTAELNEDEGIYYVTGHVENEEDATIFTPVTCDKEYGKIIVRGLENDYYSASEIQTADGYTLLTGPIYIDISVKTDDSKVCNIYSEDVLGLLQNDPRYSYSGDMDLSLANIPQKNLQHCGIAVTAEVDGLKVNMVADGDSANAAVPFVVLNTPGFDLPQTGDQGVWMYGVAGGTLMLAAVLVILFAFKKKEDQQTMKQ